MRTATANAAVFGLAFTLVASAGHLAGVEVDYRGMIAFCGCALSAIAVTSAGRRFDRAVRRAVRTRGFR